ncbi:MAG: serine--tRNA ligase [Alphaproteobacteria bacterium]
MHDLKWIRQFSEELDRGLARRGKEPLSKEILDLDTKHRAALTELQELQASRNQLAKDFAVAKRQGQETTDIAAKSEALKAKMAELETTAARLSEELGIILAGIPNHPAADIPDGLDESANEQVRQWGEPRSFDFTPRHHFELGEALQLMDFERAVKLSGSRFVVLYDQLSRLERALAAFMLDIHTREFGYREVNVPLLVKESALYGTGQFPKLREDTFQVNADHWLIPTSEVCLTNLVAEEILPSESLPLRFTAYSACFRAEAGAAGRDTRGMIRQHQFTKVEIVSLTQPDQSEEEHERMLKAAETVLQRLELPYRVMLLCAGDMGFNARKTYDLEVWLPGQNAYREISSCSNCGDFQARRMNARWRSAAGQKPEFIHTLNGSGLAVGRTIVAIMENYQEPDGSIRIPTALVPYMGGIEVIEKA